MGKEKNVDHDRVYLGLLGDRPIAAYKPQMKGGEAGLTFLRELAKRNCLEGKKIIVGGA